MGFEFLARARGYLWVPHCYIWYFCFLLAISVWHHLFPVVSSACCRCCCCCQKVHRLGRLRHRLGHHLRRLGRLRHRLHLHRHRLGHLGHHLHRLGPLGHLGHHLRRLGPLGRLGHHLRRLGPLGRLGHHLRRLGPYRRPLRAWAGLSRSIQAVRKRRESLLTG